MCVRDIINTGGHRRYATKQVANYSRGKENWSRSTVYNRKAYDLPNIEVELILKSKSTVKNHTTKENSVQWN